MNKRKRCRKNAEFTEMLNSDFIQLIEYRDFRFDILPNTDSSVETVNFFDVISNEYVNNSLLTYFKQMTDVSKLQERDSNNYIPDGILIRRKDNGYDANGKH